jgi:hypothetical protein
VPEHIAITKRERTLLGGPLDGLVTDVSHTRAWPFARGEWYRPCDCDAHWIYDPDCTKDSWPNSRARCPLTRRAPSKAKETA